MSEFQLPRRVDKYEHHSVEVTVLSEIKGQHRQHCLCYNGCKFFKPGTSENCEIAKATFKNCVTFNIVTPVYECPKYARLAAKEGK